MSDFPPASPYDLPPPLDYFPPASDNAETLVRLAVIFNYISVGLDFAGFLCFGAIGVLFFVAPDAMGPHNAGDPPPQLVGGLYVGLAALMVIFGIVKFIGTRKLQTAGPGAWGWGLTAGIIGCIQLLCGSCCCLQVAPGIYTLVILCFQNVRNYLALRQQRNAAGEVGGPSGTPPFGA
jgi:hypothetical protein